MPHNTLRVLIVEDSPDDAELILAQLAEGWPRLDSVRVETASEMSAALAALDWDVVLSDYNLPGFSAQEALALLQVSGKDIPFIIVSGCIGEEAAVAMMKAGAHDFVIKESLARLVPAVNRGLTEAETRRRYHLAQESLQKSETRFRALAANIPSVIFQLTIEDGRMQFPYVSQTCQTLFELAPQALQDVPNRLLDMMGPEERASFAASLEHSAAGLSTLNWEGRVHVGKDIKWINLRAEPRRSAGGGVIWDGIITNITCNKLAEIEIRQSQEQLRQLSAHIQTIREEERARLSREIHDDLGGTLAAIKLELTQFASRLPKRRKDLQTRIAGLDRLVDHVIEATERIAADLRPGILDCGIVAAVEWQAREFQERTGIQCEIQAAQEEVMLDAEISISVFRIFQEALTNVAKHANASKVEVGLSQNGDCFFLEVTDNGRGITAADRSKTASFGIRGMLERAREFGGDIMVSGVPGRGTKVIVRVPLAPGSAEDRRAEYQRRLF